MSEPSPLRLQRLRRGLTIWMVSRAVGMAASELSMVERGLLDRPNLIRRLEKFYKQQARPRRATA